MIKMERDDENPKCEVIMMNSSLKLHGTNPDTEKREKVKARKELRGTERRPGLERKRESYAGNR